MSLNSFAKQDCSKYYADSFKKAYGVLVLYRKEPLPCDEEEADNVISAKNAWQSCVKQLNSKFKSKHPLQEICDMEVFSLINSAQQLQRISEVQEVIEIIKTKMLEAQSLKLSRDQPIHRFLIMQCHKFVGYQWTKMESMTSWKQEKDSTIHIKLTGSIDRNLSKRKTIMIMPYNEVNQDDNSIRNSQKYKLSLQQPIRRKTVMVKKTNTSQLNDVDLTFSLYLDGCQLQNEE